MTETLTEFLRSIDYIVPMIFFGGMFVAWIGIWHLKLLDSYIEADIDEIARQGNYNRARRKKNKALHGYSTHIPTAKLSNRRDALLNKDGKKIMEL